MADRGPCPPVRTTRAVGQHHLEADDHVLDLPVAVRVLAGTPAGQPAAHRREVHRLGPVAEGEAVAVAQARLDVGPEGAGPDVGDQRVGVDVGRCRPGRRGRGPPRRRGGPRRRTPRCGPRPAVTGTRAWWQRASTAATWAVSVGRATTAGRAGTWPAAAHPMASGHQSRPASARSLVVVGDLGRRPRPAGGAARRRPPPGRRPGGRATAAGPASIGVTGVGRVTRAPVPRPVAAAPCRRRRAAACRVEPGPGQLGADPVGVGLGLAAARGRRPIRARGR